MAMKKEKLPLPVPSLRFPVMHLCLKYFVSKVHKESTLLKFQYQNQQELYLIQMLWNFFRFFIRKSGTSRILLQDTRGLLRLRRNHLWIITEKTLSQNVFQSTIKLLLNILYWTYLERMLSPQEILLTKRPYRRTAFLDLSSVSQGSTDHSVRRDFQNLVGPSGS